MKMMLWMICLSLQLTACASVHQAQEKQYNQCGKGEVCHHGHVHHNSRKHHAYRFHV